MMLGLQGSREKFNMDKMAFKKEQELMHWKELAKQFKSENSKLHKKLAKLEAKNVTLENRIKELNKAKNNNVPKEKPVTNIELARQIAFLAQKEGISPMEYIEKYAKS